MSLLDLINLFIACYTKALIADPLFVTGCTVMAVAVGLWAFYYRATFQ